MTKSNFKKFLTKKEIRTFLLASLKEDLGSGDVTSQSVFKKNFETKAVIIAKQKGVLSGGIFLEELCHLPKKNIKVKLHKKDGDLIKKKDVIATLKGPVKNILTIERLALNILGHLSGIATTTHQYVQKVPKRVKILDTRKTLALWRRFAKYAVMCGGGSNHRLGLYDMVMIKDNHRWARREETRANETLADLVLRVRKSISPRIPICLEVDTLGQLKEALPGCPDIILLDNMPPANLKKAVAISKQVFPKNTRPLLEASGGITLKNISQIGKTGVDRISIGAITHSAPNFDFSMEITRFKRS